MRCLYYKSILVWELFGLYSRVGVVVPCLVFYLGNPGSNPTGLCGLGFQSLPDCVGFPWNISLGFSSYILNWYFLACLLSMGFLASTVIEIAFLRLFGFTTKINKWNEIKLIGASVWPNRNESGAFLYYKQKLSGTPITTMLTICNFGW